MVIYGKTNVCIFREVYLLTLRYEIDYSDESHSSTTILSTLAIIFLSLDEMDSFTFDL